MGLRDKLSSALTGVPGSSDVQPRRNRDDGRSLRPSRPGQTRANAPTASTNTGHRAPRLAIEGNPASLPGPRLGRQQLAIQYSSSLTITEPPQQNSSIDPTAGPGQRQNSQTIGASRPALPAARTGRPYGNTGPQEAFAVDPSRRLPFSKPTRVSGPNRANDINAPGTPGRNNRDELLPLSEREIIDVTEEDDEVADEASPRGNVFGTAPQTLPQQASRPSNLSRQSSTPRHNDPSTRLPTGGRRDQGSTNTYPRRGGSPATAAATHTAPETGSGSRSGSFGAASTGRATGDSANQAQTLYLGVFDLEEAGPSTQQQATTSNRAGSFQEGGSSSRLGTFGQGGISSRIRTSTRLTTSISHGYHTGSVYRYPFGYRRDLHGYYRGYDWHDPLYRFGHRPWCPHAYASLSCQTVFTEVSNDYFVQESSPEISFNIDTGLGVIQRYYHGWRDAYTEALSLSLSGNSGISATDRSRIEANRDRLQSRLDEAVRRLRSGDQSVVQETLDQVRMDRQMAVEMPVTQIRWATAWIKEVWVTEHGEIPYDF